MFRLLFWFIICAMGGMLIAAVIMMRTAHAAPFVIADVPAAQCNQCKWTGGPAGFAGTSAVVVDTVRGKPAFGNRICLRDVANAAVGTSSITVACADTTQVFEDSISVPFDFVREAPPPKVENTRLVK